MDYSALARSYKPLSYTNQLRDLLAAFYQTDKYEHFNKYELAKTVNDVIFENYDGEPILKFMLAKEYRKTNYVAAFEVRAKNSRTDFLVINGDTKSFEVKSKIDTLNRVTKQISDYGDVFEFNTIVIDKSHLINVIEKLPEYYGIWYFEGNKKVIYRKAVYSPFLNASEQILLFNKKELQGAFESTEKNIILSKYNAAQINIALKSTLKKRYIERWNFVQTNWDNILPIDMQFFFNTNVKPEIIYGI
jgi:hypothetical protein